METWTSLILAGATALGAIGSTVVLAIHYRGSLRGFWDETKDTRKKIAALIIMALVVFGPWVGILTTARTFSRTHGAFLEAYRALSESRQTFQETMGDVTEGSLRVQELTRVTIDILGDRIEELEDRVAALEP